MKPLLCLAAALALATPAWAHDEAPAPGSNRATHTPSSTGVKARLDAHTLEDIERHRGMARAHEQAAQCLEQGSDHADCMKQLQASCKGLALGKHCGMRHSH